MKEFLLKKKKFLNNREIVLNIILDGIGISSFSNGNAFFNAETPNLDQVKKKHLYREIYAHGTHVGLPSDEDMGNSEVGHNTLGAGNIYPQGAKLVNLAIKENQIIKNSNWKKAITQVQQFYSQLHFIGLLSDGNVHSHIDHLKYLIEQAVENKIEKIFVHALLDGRDTDPHSSLDYLKDLNDFFQSLKKQHYILPQIASFGGRMVMVMDRYEANWKMVELGWKVIVEGDGQGNYCCNPEKKVQEIKKDNPNLSDQYIPPFVVVDEKNNPLAPIKDNDSVIFFNFRGDRAIEICQAFENENITSIQKKKHPKVFFLSLLEYDADKKIPQHFLVKPPKIDKVMSKYLTQNQVRLFALSETQKFGHVTYFWNGNRFNKFDEKLEDYFEIPSDNLNFDQKPEMKSSEIANKTIELIKSQKYSYGRINFPNGDMVGHTGNYLAAKKSVEAVDNSLSQILSALTKVNGIAIILSDHGNCEEMYQLDKKNNLKKDTNGNPIKKNSHTTNLVPLYIFDPLYNQEYSWQELPQPGLSNIASTTLELLNFKPPQHFQPSLLKWNN